MKILYESYMVSVLVRYVIGTSLIMHLITLLHFFQSFLLFFSLFHICFISCFQEEELNNNEGSYRRMTKPCKGGARTGWPQHVWALELKN